ncbi:MAG: DUF1465 family protein [Pseudomonadota bacterium]
MEGAAQHFRFNRRLVDSLYIDAMVLADEARSYFDDYGRAERDILAPVARVGFSCESIKVTTRLMHVIAWLLTQRAVAAGELSAAAARDPSRRLGDAPLTDAEALIAMPASARALIRASIELHRRVAVLDAEEAAAPSPARAMLDRLALAF